MSRSNVVACSVLLGGLLLTSVTALCEEALPIKDNSFLIEEAYNQEPNVIQHIVTVQHYASPQRFWGLAYTEEIPMFGMRHQLSWTAPLISDYRGDDFTLTDLTLNYRLQLLDGSSGVAVAPRVSIVAPLGDHADPRGLVLQFNLPLSAQMSSEFVGHLNVGGTFAPNAEFRDIFEESRYVKRDLNSYFAGASVVWLANLNINVLCELLFMSNAEFDYYRGDVMQISETVVNPGLRFAINAPFGQFVPGIGIPIRMTEGETDAGFFGYLSFEHSL